MLGRNSSKLWKVRAMDQSKSIRGDHHRWAFTNVTRTAARAKRHLVKAQAAVAALRRALSWGQKTDSSEALIPFDETWAEHAACDAIIADIHRQADRVTAIETSVAKLRQWKRNDNE